MRGVVRRRPVLAYFLLAYAASWLGWLPYVLSRNGLGVLPIRFTGALGHGLGTAPGAFLGPLGAAVVVTLLCEGRAGLRTWRARLLRWRVGPRWYVFAVLGVPLLTLAATAVLPAVRSDVRSPGIGAVAAFFAVLVVQVVTTGLAEEPGWQGFALPRLQDRYGPVPGAALLGVGWFVWHLPLFLTDWARAGAGFPILAAFLLSLVAFSMVLAWAFNRSGGSVVVTMLAHAANNTVLSTLWLAVFPLAVPAEAYQVHLIGYGALAVVLVAATRGRLGYRRQPSGPRRHRAGTAGGPV